MALHFDNTGISGGGAAQLQWASLTGGANLSYLGGGVVYANNDQLKVIDISGLDAGKPEDQRPPGRDYQ